MVRQIGPEAVAEHFTLDPAELELLRNKSGATRLGFAVGLKFLLWKGRFPRGRAGLPDDGIERVAAQVGVGAADLGFYDFTGRQIKNHRAGRRVRLERSGGAERPRVPAGCSARPVSVRRTVRPRCHRPPVGRTVRPFGPGRGRRQGQRVAAFRWLACRLASRCRPAPAAAPCRRPRWLLSRRPRRGAGNNGAMSTGRAFSLLNGRGHADPVVAISERIKAFRRQRRVLERVTRAAWRLEQAERERAWALASARAEGLSIRQLAKAVGLSPTRVYQIVTAADPDETETALGDLRSMGWPAPEDPDSDEDAELDGRDLIADRIGDEVGWLRRCVAWLAQLDAGDYPPVVNLRPASDWPDTANTAVTSARVQAVLERVAGDLDELARARRIADLNTAAVLADRRAERRRRLAEPDLGFREFCARKKLPASSTLQLERAWDAWQEERHRRGETTARAAYTDNPFRPR